MVIFTGMIAAPRPSYAANHQNQNPNSIRTTQAVLNPHFGRSKHQRRQLIIVKFGGSSLSNARKVSLAAQSVAREYSRGNRVVVVVSAVGRTTDQLLELTDAWHGMVETDRDDILAMGERTSARIFAASLKSRGMQARYFDPADKDWPIITDERFSNANIREKETVQRVKRYMKPLLGDGIVPVIGGFIGRTKDGRISTLGRGGSDTTALLLARALGADEVVLVTNAPGILSADPKVIHGARALRKIDMRALVGIADTGTKFIHRKALNFKDPSINIRVVPNEAGNLQAPGTLITGGPLSELDVKVHNPHPVASVTLVGRELPRKPGLIKKILKVAGRNLVAMSQDRDSAILYIKQTRDLTREVAALHETIVKDPSGIALATRTGMALVTVKGVGLEETPGVVAKISDALRVGRINIFGVLTITSSVLVLVDWNVRREAARLMRNSLENN